MKYNFREFFYRFFLLIAVGGTAYSAIISLQERTMSYIGIGLLLGIGVYVSFFLFEWVICGLFNAKTKGSFLKRLVLKLQTKEMFIIFLIILVSLNIATIGTINKKQKIIIKNNKEIEQLKKCNTELNELLDDTETLENYLLFMKAKKESEKELEELQKKNTKPINLSNLPILPDIKKHYYYIETPVQYSRPATYSTSQPIQQTTTNKYNPYQATNDMLQNDIDNLRQDMMFRDMRYERDHSY